MITCFLLLNFLCLICGEPAEDCFKSNQIVPESNLGAISLFPWLGLLMVRLHEATSFNTAVTGVALVKDRYGIAIASDIIKIPRTLLGDHTRVMFIVENNLKWYVKINDYIAHPERELNIHSIVLIELETLYGEPFKAKPICWPKQGMEVTNLYSFEYVDDAHYTLQKRIKKMMYIENHMCYDFYEKASMKVYLLHARTLCAFSINSKKFCLCDNGHVLASNDSGHWVIIGLGMFGPSCAAPTRFINLQSYFKWITLVTAARVNDKTSIFRSVLGVGFMKPEKPFEEQPLHESPQTSFQEMTRRRMFRLLPKQQNTIKNFYYTGSRDLTQYAFGKSENQKFYVPPNAYTDTYNDSLLFSVNQKRINELKITILSESKGPIPYTVLQNDSCTNLKNLQYREYQYFQGYAEGWNYVNYWVTIADEYVKKYACILINLNSKIRGTLKFVSYMYKANRVDLEDRDEIPEALIRHKKLEKLFGKKRGNQSTTPNPIPEPSDKDIMSFNILVNFAFKDKADLQINVYGIRSGEPYSPYKYLLQDTRRMSDQNDTIAFVHKEEIPDDTEMARLFDVPDEIAETTENSTVQQTNVTFNNSSKVSCVFCGYLLSFVILFKEL